MIIVYIVILIEKLIKILIKRRCMMFNVLTF